MMATVDDIHADHVHQAIAITQRHNDWSKSYRRDLQRYAKIYRRICGRSYRVKMSLLSMLPVGSE